MFGENGLVIDGGLKNGGVSYGGYWVLERRFIETCTNTCNV